MRFKPGHRIEPLKGAPLDLKKLPAKWRGV